ncbi:MAG: hypothetical protein AAF236_17440, partial [Verrucomicrobiota bacterium]
MHTMRYGIWVALACAGLHWVEAQELIDVDKIKRDPQIGEELTLPIGETRLQFSAANGRRFLVPIKTGG